jgi:hypothetical protein
LAGRLGVAIACALQNRGLLTPAADKRFEVTAAGAIWWRTAWISRPARMVGPYLEYIQNFLPCSVISRVPRGDHRDWLSKSNPSATLKLFVSGLDEFAFRNARGVPTAA